MFKSFSKFNIHNKFITMRKSHRKFYSNICLDESENIHRYSNHILFVDIEPTLDFFLRNTFESICVFNFFVLFVFRISLILSVASNPIAMKFLFVLINWASKFIMPRGNNKIVHSNDNYMLGDGKSYQDINKEIIWICIAMAALIAFLIILALCYIAYEKWQKYREVQIRKTHNSIRKSWKICHHLILFSALGDWTNIEINETGIYMLIFGTVCLQSS